MDTDLLMAMHLQTNRIYAGDARALLPRIQENSVACSIWSPPYFVGKNYEAYLKSHESWAELIREVIQLHFRAIKPGGFVVVNIADILCYPDPAMPKIPAENISHRRSSVTRRDVLTAMKKHPRYSRYKS
jgi:DNA modification methylase